ncbi:MAG: hypothetical protein AB7U75_01875 [Hyphomicrobiaceae bacterium]
MVKISIIGRQDLGDARELAPNNRFTKSDQSFLKARAVILFFPSGQGFQMPLRFKVLSVVFLIVFLLAQEEGLQLFKTYHATLGALVLLAVFSLVALWPNSSRTDRVDRSMDGANWSDRVDFDKVKRD